MDINKPLICSTGMSSEEEINETITLLKRHGAMYILLHCNSTYPAPFKDINLNYIKRLQEIGDCPVGYSGHERGIHIPIAAVSMGAKLIEKHLTLDKSLEGNDHKVSLLPEEFKSMVECIRDLEQALGKNNERFISQGELINREALAKSLIINRNLEIGKTITSNMIEVKSPGKGLQPNRKKELVGIHTKRSMNSGDFFYPSDLLSDQIQARPYRFKRNWGLPVRYHDFHAIYSCSNFDFVEFHLSYKDLEIDIKNLDKSNMFEYLKNFPLQIEESIQYFSNKKCEKIFGFNLEGYGKTRMYAFLAERYLSYWFNKYTKPLLWPVIFFDITKKI